MASLTFKKKSWAFFVGTIFVVLVGLTFMRYRWFSREYTNALIAQDVARLKDIFERIDATCGIINFEHEKNHIDFLNVISFVGSEVGSMNLRNPSFWQGPYIKDNPTMQEKYYQIVVTPSGHFIAPGDGVKLGNGKIIGKDIILNKDSDFAKLMRTPEALLAGKISLAARIEFGTKKTSKYVDSTVAPVMPPEVLTQLEDAD